MVRAFWFLVGSISLVLGLVGILLPLLPTVPFLILTAFCYARASDRLHGWLMAHPKLGPSIHDWQNTGAINRKAKKWATASIVAAFCVSLALGVPSYALLLQAGVLCCVMLFIWTRPER